MNPNKMGFQGQGFLIRFLHYRVLKPRGAPSLGGHRAPSVGAASPGVSFATLLGGSKSDCKSGYNFPLICVITIVTLLMTPLISGSLLDTILYIFVISKNPNKD